MKSTSMPSKRGELEITALNNMYLESDRLHLEKLPRGFAWLDTGTFDSLADASHYIETIEKRQGQKVACLEEIAYSNGWITKDNVGEAAENLGKSEYGKYLKKLTEENQ